MSKDEKVVVFEQEDEVDGVVVGRVTVSTQPDSNIPETLTKEQARELAEAIGARFEVRKPKGRQ